MLLINAFIVICLIAIAVTSILPFMNVRHVGGLYHWRIGRVGGSFYLKAAPRKPKARREPPLRFARRAYLHHKLAGFGVDPQPVDRDLVKLRQRIQFAMGRADRAQLIFA